jgi:outer membrane scaffolding protein for murein synthesis (MipA/OmpV family)
MPLALCMAALALPASGEEKPLWEIGLGVGVVSFPDYRGSRHQRTIGLPVPYLFGKSSRPAVSDGG